MGNFTTDELEQLRDDLGTQISVHGGSAAADVVPRGLLQRQVKEIAEGDTRQTNKGLLGAGVGAVAGGGLGALATGLAKGRKAAPMGLLGMVPGAIAGYGIGKDREQQAQLDALLQDQLADPKTAGLEQGFETILDELKDSKMRGTLKAKDVTDAIQDLAEGRTIPISKAEKDVLSKALGSQYVKKTTQGATKRTVSKGLLNAIRKNKTPFAILGGLAALGTLGLGAASLAKKPSWAKSLTKQTEKDNK